jgi:hypothetical protein
MHAAIREAILDNRPLTFLGTTQTASAIFEFRVRQLFLLIGRKIPVIRQMLR